MQSLSLHSGRKKQFYNSGQARTHDEVQSNAPDNKEPLEGSPLILCFRRDEGISKTVGILPCLVTEAEAATGPHQKAHRILGHTDTSTRPLR